MLLTTQVHGAHLRGKLIQPKHFTEESDGSFIDVTLPVIMRPLSGKNRNKAIAIEIDGPTDVDHISMVLLDQNHLSLDNFHGIVPPWKFERVHSGEQVIVKTDWPSVNMASDVVSFRERLQVEANKDRAAREKEHFDDEEMARQENEALPLLNEVFEAYGWPTVTVFGAKAATDYWLLVQHQEPDIQKRMVGSMQEAVSKGEASQTHYAYLSDRIQVLEGKPQHWGTQSKCEHGHAILYPLDASTKEVDFRRKTIGLEALNGDELESLCQRSAR